MNSLEERNVGNQKVELMYRVSAYPNQVYTDTIHENSLTDPGCLPSSPPIA